jgi:non-heme chloroperoxidase
MMGGHKPLYDCIEAFPETDLTEDLRRIDLPTLIIQGDDDQIVPIVASALLSFKIVKGANAQDLSRSAAWVGSTLKDKVNAEMLAFIGEGKTATA